MRIKFEKREWDRQSEREMKSERKAKRRKEQAQKSNVIPAFQYTNTQSAMLHLLCAEQEMNIYIHI